MDRVIQGEGIIVGDPLATCVIHLRGGGRKVQRHPPTRYICIPVLVSPAVGFSQSYYELVDIREIGGEIVATYEPSEGPSVMPWEGPPENRWARLLRLQRAFWRRLWRARVKFEW